MKAQMKARKKVTINKQFIALAMAIIMGIMMFQGTGYVEAGTSANDLKWETEGTMPVKKRCQNSFASGDNVYIFGGFPAGNDCSKSVDIYNTKNKTWSTGADIPTEYRNRNMAQKGNKVYVMGGENKSNVATTDVHVYDIAANSWTALASMPRGCNYGNATVLDNKIYVFGGYNTSDDGKGYLFIYDIINNSWTTKNMPYKQIAGICHNYNGKIYVIGGEYWTTTNTTIGTVTIYDPAKDTWSTGQSMPTKAEQCASVIIDGKIYAIGGLDYSKGDDKFIDKVQIYDIEKNSWSSGPQLTSARGTCTASLVNEKIYLFGGTEAKSFNPVDIVEVLDLNPVEIQLSILMYQGEEQQLSISFNLPDNKKYEWSSSNDSVITVDANGVVTAVSEGIAKVTVKNSDGSYTETISIKVIGVRKLAGHILVGDTIKLHLVDDPSTVTWKSSNKAVAEVDDTGLVKGLKKGLVKITAELDGKEYELFVRVSTK